jgi:hypothetical protein
MHSVKSGRRRESKIASCPATFRLDLASRRREGTSPVRLEGTRPVIGIVKEKIVNALGQKRT